MADKYDQLGPAGRRLARVPRYGRLIAMLPVNRFDRLVSEPATFWELYTYSSTYISILHKPSEETGVLDSGLRATKAGTLGFGGTGQPPSHFDFRQFQIRRACDILGAFAFEMFLAPLRDRGARSDVGAVRRNVIQRLRAAEVPNYFGSEVEDPYTLDHDIESLFAMDAVDLKYFIFTSRHQEIRWTDITTQAFFAAYWACRWSSESDRAILRTWIPDPREHKNKEYLEFWRMVAEMPEEACDRERYELLLSPLYDGSFLDDGGIPTRSSELIYRTWDRMKETAASRKFRSEFCELLRGKRGKQLQKVAQGLLTDPQGESQFLSLCDGKPGEFVFEMGAPDGEDPDPDGGGDAQDNPLHSVRLSHYRLHRFCVTNVEFELFDRRRELRRAFADEGRDVSRHPAVDVTWYDAWCFARFVGEWEIGGKRYRMELPTEAEWEYACRAGQSTPFTWGGNLDGTRIESTYCNFAGDYPWSASELQAVEVGPNRGRTMPVDEFAPNPWGFYQMHGNVWEWCADRYERDFYRRGDDQEVVDPLCDSALAWARVLRGGCWYGSGRYCRSAHRYGDAPEDRSRVSGFRLAAVPESRDVRRLAVDSQRSVGLAGMGGAARRCRSVASDGVQGRSPWSR